MFNDASGWSLVLENKIRYYTWSDIDKIYVNESKGTVAVKFYANKMVWNKKYDPSKPIDAKNKRYISTNTIKVKKHADELLFNVRDAVAAALMIRKYGSNSAFKARIYKHAGIYSDLLYMNIARYEVGLFFDGYDKFLETIENKIVYTDKKKEKNHGGETTDTE